MAIPKILGIETEYGISGGPSRDPILASSIIVNAYALEGQSRTNWDFQAERPDRDARGELDLVSYAPVVETQLANSVLTNGARLYVDHAHPEYSSPECRTPLSATLYDVAGEEVMRRAQNIANQSLPVHDAITLYKNNSDGKGNSYGTHENYLVSRSIEFADIVKAMVPHFCSRQIVSGAGKVGAETDKVIELQPSFQISQRAEFFEEIIGLETTLKRPIVNTRDEPHADAERFRRLHVINGDANMSQVATFVKLGATAVLLGALEEYGVKVFPENPANPVAAIRRFGADPTMRVCVETSSGKKMSAIDYQEALIEVAVKFIDDTGGSAVAPSAEVDLLLDEWKRIVHLLRTQPDELADTVDWIAKLRLVKGYQHRYGLADNDSKLRAIDLQYHDISSEKSLARRIGLRNLFDSDAIREAVINPPTDTRAYFRGHAVSKFSKNLVAANWDSLVFDFGDGPLHRVPMLDPLRGTAELTQNLLETSNTAAELLKKLEGELTI